MVRAPTRGSAFPQPLREPRPRPEPLGGETQTLPPPVTPRTGPGGLASRAAAWCQWFGSPSGWPHPSTTEARKSARSGNSPARASTPAPPSLRFLVERTARDHCMAGDRAREKRVGGGRRMGPAPRLPRPRAYPNLRRLPPWCHSRLVFRSCRIASKSLRR